MYGLIDTRVGLFIKNPMKPEDILSGSLSFISMIHAELIKSEELEAVLQVSYEILVANPFISNTTHLRITEIQRRH